MWKVFRNSLIALLGIAALGFSAPAEAQFLGSTMTLFYDFPALGSHFDTRVFVVGAGVEAPDFPTGDPRTNIDISNTNIFVTYNSSASWTSTSFNGFVLFDSSSTVPDITGVSINAATNMSGFDASRVSFDANNIYVNWQGLPFDTSTIVSLDVTFRSPDIVPEPGPLALMGGLCAGGLSLLLHRRRAS